VQDGAVLQSQTIAPNLFGEGIVNWGGEIVSLTMARSGGFPLGPEELRAEVIFPIRRRRLGAHPGWQAPDHERRLAVLKVLDPVTFREVRHIRVTADGRPVENLNELEWVKGEILANIWQTHRIARIDPATGKVKAWIDLTGLPETLSSANPDAG